MKLTNYLCMIYVITFLIDLFL